MHMFSVNCTRTNLVYASGTHTLNRVSFNFTCTLRIRATG